MFEFAPGFNQKIGSRLEPVLNLVYLKLGLSPNLLSILGFIVGTIAAGLLIFGKIGLALVVLAVALAFDGLDGAVARRFGLESDFGAKLDQVLDRTNEAIIFLSLAVAGLASYQTVALALVAIFLMTMVKGRSRFDPGFKRISLFVGYFIGFDLALRGVFWVNLAGFIISLLILDYRFRQELDY